jgi:hypothetical protein
LKLCFTVIPDDGNTLNVYLQVGTKLFVEELGKRFFSPADDVMMKVSGRQLTLPYLNQSGFNHPILVTDRDGLSMTVPQVRSTNVSMTVSRVL